LRALFSALLKSEAAQSSALAMVQTVSVDEHRKGFESRWRRQSKIAP
jgi:hypothetical protein